MTSVAHRVFRTIRFEFIVSDDDDEIKGVIKVERD